MRPGGALPAGQRSEQMASPAMFALGGLQLRKVGRGNNCGSCAINVDLDSLRKFSVLLPEENRLIPGGLRKDLVDGPCIR